MIDYEGYAFFWQLRRAIGDNIAGFVASNEEEVFTIDADIAASPAMAAEGDILQMLPRMLISFRQFHDASLLSECHRNIIFTLGAPLREPPPPRKAHMSDGQGHSRRDGFSLPHLISSRSAILSRRPTASARSIAEDTGFTITLTGGGSIYRHAMLSHGHSYNDTRADLLR